MDHFISAALVFISCCLLCESTSLRLGETLQILVEEASPNCVAFIHDSDVKSVLPENLPHVDILVTEDAGLKSPMRDCQFNVLWLTEYEDVVRILDPSVLKRAHTYYVWMLPQIGYNGSVPKFFEKVVNLAVIDPGNSVVNSPEGHLID